MDSQLTLQRLPDESRNEARSSRARRSSTNSHRRQPESTSVDVALARIIVEVQLGDSLFVMEGVSRLKKLRRGEKDEHTFAVPYEVSGNSGVVW